GDRCYVSYLPTGSRPCQRPCQRQTRQRYLSKCRVIVCPAYWQYPGIRRRSTDCGAAKRYSFSPRSCTVEPANYIRKSMCNSGSITECPLKDRRKSWLLQSHAHSSPGLKAGSLACFLGEKMPEAATASTVQAAALLADNRHRRGRLEPLPGACR